MRAAGRGLGLVLAVVVALTAAGFGVVTMTTWVAAGTAPGARELADPWPLALLATGAVLAGVGLAGLVRDGARRGERTAVLAVAALVWALTVDRVTGIPYVATAAELGLGPMARPWFVLFGLALGLFALGLGPGARGGGAPGWSALRERPLLVFVLLTTANGKLATGSPDVGLAMVAVTGLLAAVCLVGDQGAEVLGLRLLRRAGRPLVLASLALLAWWCVASAAAVNADAAWRLTLRLVPAGLLALATLAALPEERAAGVARRVVDLLVLGLALTLVLGVVGVAEAARVFPLSDVLASRLRILGANPNLVGAFLALGLPLVLGWLFGAPDGRPSRGRRMAGSLLVAAVVVGLYLGRSRASLLGAGLGGGLFLVTLALPAARGALGRVGTRGIAVAAALALVAVGALVSPLGAGLRADLDQRAMGQSALGQRWHFWRMASEASLDRPLTGLGPANFAGHAQVAQPSYYDGTVQTWHTHNLPLAALEGGGVPGAALFLVWLVLFLGLLTRLAGTGGGALGAAPALGLWAGCLGLFAANQLDLGQSQLTFVPLVWWLALVVAGLARPATAAERTREERAAAAAPASGDPRTLALTAVLALVAWPAGPGLLVGHGLAEAARRAADAKDHDRAIALAEAAAAPWLVTDRFVLLGNLAKWHAIEGRPARRLALLEESCRGNPRSSPGWYRYANALLQTGRFEAAAEAADRAYLADPRGVHGPRARTLQAWAALGLGQADLAATYLLEGLAGGGTVPKGLPAREVTLDDGGTDLLLPAAAGPAVSLLGRLQARGEELVVLSGQDELTARREIPGLVAGFRHLDRPLEAAAVVERMIAAMDDPIRSVYYAWLELLVEAGELDRARTVLAASPFRDEPSMRDLFPGGEGAPGAADLALGASAFGADLFYTSGQMGDLHLQQALLELERGDLAAAERALEQALYVASDPGERTRLAHAFLMEAPGGAEDKLRDVGRYLEAGSISLVNLQHKRRIRQAAGVLLDLGGGDPAKARALFDQLGGDFGPLGEAVLERLDGR